MLGSIFRPFTFPKPARTCITHVHHCARSCGLTIAQHSLYEDVATIHTEIIVLPPGTRPLPIVASTYWNYYTTGPTTYEPFNIQFKLLCCCCCCCCCRYRCRFCFSCFPVVSPIGRFKNHGYPQTLTRSSEVSSSELLTIPASALAVTLPPPAPLCLIPACDAGIDLSHVTGRRGRRQGGGATFLLLALVI